MPTTTFFNLPEAKRERLLSAIRDEFARVPFEQVSINKIICSANISRGSFYQYFKDKYDMLEYILSDYQKQMLTFAKESLEASGGNIFQLCQDMFNFTIGFVLEGKNNSFCKNLFADIKINAGFYSCKSRDIMQSRLLNEMEPLIARDMLDLRRDSDFTDIMAILSSVTRDAIVETFMDIAHYQNARQKYLTRLALLKRVFLKNKEYITSC